MILVTGCDSAKGKAIFERLQAASLVAVGLSHSDCQQTADHLARQLAGLTGVHLIIHAFELSDLQRAEAYPDLAHQLNVEVTEVVAAYAASKGIPLVFLSSHLVFDGGKKNPYIAANPLHPLNVYGRSKALAERRLFDRHSHALVLRLGWMLDLEADGWLDQQVRDVREGVALLASPSHMVSPTCVYDVANVVLAMVRQVLCQIEVWGIFHYGGSEPVSHAELVMTIGKALSSYLPGCDAQYEVCETGRSPIPSVMLPANGVLGCIKLRNTFGIKQKAWRQALPVLLNSRLGALRGGPPGVPETADVQPLRAESG
ncbi:MAG: sugar nucleotide-binding protein [Hahellaceae bacterium]|nr:sugar nucleotide-binding protein [Hahellaceae bacterium]